MKILENNLAVRVLRGIGAFNLAVGQLVIRHRAWFTAVHWGGRRIAVVVHLASVSN
jgi:uncharacterized membrane protein